VFISFEGPEGSGKTTQISYLHQHLARRSVNVILVREPGGTPVGNQIRTVLLDRKNEMEPIAELLLYSASRAQLVARVIRPHLAMSGVVLCDRYADSTVAYQGYGRGLDLTLLKEITRFATGDLKPDLTLYLDIDPAHGLARRAGSSEGLNRMDAQALDFHRRVRDGYLALMAAEPERWISIDADQPMAAVQGTIIATVEEQLARRGLLTQI
jgi:dTMP kinase